MLAENLGICFVIRDFEKGRKAVAINLDPVPTFITKCTIKPINIKEFEEAFDQIESK